MSPHTKSLSIVTTDVPLVLPFPFGTTSMHMGRPLHPARWWIVSKFAAGGHIKGRVTGQPHGGGGKDDRMLIRTPRSAGPPRLIASGTILQRSPLGGCN